MQTNNQQPLWKRLNETIFDLNGRISVTPEIDKKKGISYMVMVRELESAKKQYQRLATTNLESLAEALQKIIDMNIQNAIDQYGDAKKAETWACVTVAKEALTKIS